MNNYYYCFLNRNFSLTIFPVNYEVYSRLTRFGKLTKVKKFNKLDLFFLEDLSPNR